MRIAALYDIHGNLPALEATLEAVRREQVDLVVVGGDIFPGPMAIECLALLHAFDRRVRFIRGNGDRQVIEVLRDQDRIPEAYRESMLWNAQGIPDSQREEIEHWPLGLTLSVDGVGDVRFCHATPRSDTEIFTVETPEVHIMPAFNHVDADVIVCGHTHMQFDRQIDGLRVINAGSVGMPFGTPGAYWLELGPAIVLRRTEYDYTDAARRVRASGYPQAESFAANNVLQPPAAADMLAVFSRAASR